MTIEQFNSLDEGSKAVVIFEADKISEIRTDFTKFELFSIANFFVEARTSVNYNFKRTILTYTVNNLPSFYSTSATTRQNT